MEIFYRCDLDGNGYLSREEFNQFQMRSSGECCDDESWDVVKGIILHHYGGVLLRLITTGNNQLKDITIHRYNYRGNLYL